MRHATSNPRQRVVRTRASCPVTASIKPRSRRVLQRDLPNGQRAGIVPRRAVQSAQSHDPRVHLQHVPRLGADRRLAASGQGRAGARVHDLAPAVALNDPGRRAQRVDQGDRTGVVDGRSAVTVRRQGERRLRCDMLAAHLVDRLERHEEARGEPAEREHTQRPTQPIVKARNPATKADHGAAIYTNAGPRMGLGNPILQRPRFSGILEGIRRQGRAPLTRTQDLSP